MPVETIDETEQFPQVERLSAALEQLLQELEPGSREVTLVLANDTTVAELNERDRGVSGPTDVLSYPTHEPTDSGFPTVAHLGDIIISLDTARRQAQEAGHDLLTEVATLAAHGLVHLGGHDHQEQEQWAPFLAAQSRIVELLRQPEETS